MFDKETIVKRASEIIDGAVDIREQTYIQVLDDNGSVIGELEDMGTQYQVRVNGVFMGYIEKPVNLKK